MLPFGSMRVTAISDLHGAVEHLDAVAAGCDALLILGDLINVLDYRTMDGILVEVFGREPVAEATRLRTEGRFEEARAAIRQLVGEEQDFREQFVGLARREYERSVLRGGIRFVDGEVVRLGSMTFGFVGGGIRTPLGVPGEVSEQEYDAKLEGIGAVDVVCTHMPPRLPWYTYDVVGRKFEPGSVGLLAYVQRHQPRYALFGHVHQPLVNRGTVGATEMVNVGHFQASGRGFSIDVPD
jgi:Icc-related predicted phosphoesterase